MPCAVKKKRNWKKRGREDIVPPNQSRRENHNIMAIIIFFIFVVFVIGFSLYLGNRQKHPADIMRLAVIFIGGSMELPSLEITYQRLHFWESAA